MQNNKLVSALEYQAIGLSIIPTGGNKKPLIDSWKQFQEKCATVEEINSWWTKWPDANPACVTGKISGIVVLDLDKKHNRTSKEFNLPITVCAKSGNGGEHFFFKYPKDISIKSGSAISGEGVDCRGDGGYVLLSPSINESGGRYEWTIPFESNENLAEIPDWFKKLTSDNSKEKKWLIGKDGVAEGSRNDTATSMAGKILSSTDPELWESLGWNQLQIWNNKNTKPLSEKELRSVWESIKIRKISTKNEPKDNSLLNEICNRDDVTLFHDEQNDAHIALDISGHQEVWQCDSSSIKNLLAFMSWNKDKKPLGSEAKKSMVGVLEGKALFEGPKIKLHNRVAWHDDNLWYDLTNTKWQTIKINKNGWEIIDRSPIIFSRHSHHQSQVIPTQNGNIKLFLDYINITNPEHRLLFLVFLVSCFIPDFPHAMLVIFGAQGSSKSTLSKLSRLLIDPSIIDVVALPEKQNELVQTLAHHHCLFFDNVSHVSEDSSDTICRSITGSGFSKRKLYKNDEDIIYKFFRCLAINGINLVTLRPDLLERSLLIELERIDPKKRKTEKALYANFNKDLPSILGGVFDTLVKAIQIQPTIKLDSQPRMADWALWGCAIAEAIGYTKEEFLIAYENNINRQGEMLLNENIVATTLFSFMENKEEWRGTATELLKQLTPIDHYFDKQEKYWPKSAGSLSRKLNELSTYLKQMGLLVAINTTGAERYIDIKKIVKNKETPNEPIQLSLSDDTDDISKTK